MTEVLCVVSFPGTHHAPVEVAQHQPLAEVLTVQNSPVLFGCRTGICGTCLVRAVGELPAPSGAEQELLDLLAPHQAGTRLACQIDVTTDIQITALDA